MSISKQTDSSVLEIRHKALLIADAHYPHHGNELVEILEKIKHAKIVTDQIFLMGDIFDLLFGHNRYIQSFSKKAIGLLEELSTEIEIHYLEGNHDFCLDGIFPDMKVYGRSDQPIRAKLGRKSVMLSHGDIYDAGMLYGIYSFLLRNALTLNLLKPFQYTIIDDRMRKLKEKNICSDRTDMDTKIDKIVSHYPEDIDLIIEGHFHRGVVTDRYMSLPSLACQKSLAVVENSTVLFVPLEKL